MCACACTNACIHVQCMEEPICNKLLFEFLSVGTTYFKSQLMWLRRGLSSWTDNKAHSVHDRSIPEPQRYCPTEVISLWYMCIPPSLWSFPHYINFFFCVHASQQSCLVRYLCLGLFTYDSQLSSSVVHVVIFYFIKNSVIMYFCLCTCMYMHVCIGVAVWLRRDYWLVVAIVSRVCLHNILSLGGWGWSVLSLPGQSVSKLGCSHIVSYGPVMDVISSYYPCYAYGKLYSEWHGMSRQ